MSCRAASDWISQPVHIGRGASCRERNLFQKKKPCWRFDGCGMRRQDLPLATFHILDTFDFNSELTVGLGLLMIELGAGGRI